MLRCSKGGSVPRRTHCGSNSRFLLAAAVLFFEASLPLAHGATWTKLTNLAPSSAYSQFILLTDGTVMVQAGSSQSWMRLTPDSHGSYINGTWSTNISSMSTPRIYNAA